MFSVSKFKFSRYSTAAVATKPIQMFIRSMQLILQCLPFRITMEPSVQVYCGSIYWPYVGGSCTGLVYRHVPLMSRTKSGNSSWTCWWRDKRGRFTSVAVDTCVCSVPLQFTSLKPATKIYQGQYIHSIRLHSSACSRCFCFAGCQRPPAPCWVPESIKPRHTMRPKKLHNKVLVSGVPSLVAAFTRLKIAHIGLWSGSVVTCYIINRHVTIQDQERCCMTPKMKSRHEALTN